MMGRVAALLALCALLTGCAQDPPTDGDQSDTATSTAPTGDGSGLFNTTPAELAPAFVQFNQTFDFFVTYVSAVESGGTNAGQRNCVYFEPVTMANATATATWDPELPGEEQLELVTSGFQGSASTFRVTGGSPLVLEFTYAKGANDVVVSVQSPAMGAVQQLPVQLTIEFDHWDTETPEFFETSCAF